MRAPFIIYGVLLIVPGVIAAVALRGRPGRGAGAPLRATRILPELARALRDRAFRAAAAANLADGFAVIGVRSAIVPLFVRDVLHQSAVWTGIGFGVVAVLNAATLLPAGRLADRFGRRPVVTGGCLVSAAGMVMLALLAGLAGLGGYLAALAVFGVGSGLLDVGPAAMIGDTLGERGGTVVAAYQMSGDIGSVTGPVTAGYLVDVASYPAAFGLAAGVLGLAAGLALLAPETRWVQQPPAAAVTVGGPRAE
jgi:MFS family permease